MGEQLKENPATSHIPIIYLTAHSDSENILKALRLGAADYIIKPFSRTELLLRVNNQLRMIQLEREAKRRDKLLQQQSIVTTQGEIISMLAHQWRQPLAAIMAKVGFLQLHILEEEPQKVKIAQDLQEIETIALELSDTISELMGLKNAQGISSPMDISTLYDDLLAHVKRMLNTDTIVFQLDEKSIQRISSNSKQLLLLCFKLYENSVEAIRDRNVADGKVIMSVNEDSTHYIITIEDNGGGVDDALLETMFEPYVSTKSVNARGLGLYTAKMIVEHELKGTILSENAEEGLRCTIRLPKSNISS